MRTFRIYAFLCKVKVEEAIHSIVSEDSSPTLFSEVFGESYRSASGAVTESEYIFLRNGLFRYMELRTSITAGTPHSPFPCPAPHPRPSGSAYGFSSLSERAAAHEPLQSKTPIRILEYGFGTGLNALVTAAAADRGDLPEGSVIEYTSLDLYPLDEQQCSALRYAIDCPSGCDTLLRKIHAAPWSSPRTPDGSFHEILPTFRFRKLKVDFTEYNPLEDNIFRSDSTSLCDCGHKSIQSGAMQWIDVVYFDPFSPDCEPQCWSEDIFCRIAAAMRPCAVLSTYSAKGDVKRALRAAGLAVRRIPGTGRKRHNLVAVK